MKKILLNSYSAIFLSLGLILTSCGANESILKSGKEATPSANAAVAVSTVEKDIDDMRTADFGFIYVLRRKDGGPIDAADRGVIKAQTFDANRRVSSDSGKAFVVGSNHPLAPERLSALNDRFAVENLSTAPSVIPENQVNSNK